MRRTLIFLLVAILIFNVGFTASAVMPTQATQQLTLRMNNSIIETEVPPVIIDGRTLVPARSVFEELGADVGWEPNERKVSVIMEGKKIVLHIDNNIARVNDEEVELDVAAKIIDGRTMIPVRFVAESLNYDVGWDGDKRIVSINEKPKLELEIKYIVYENKVVLDLGADIEYKVMRLPDPDRIILDFENAIIPHSKKEVFETHKFLEEIRIGQATNTTSRLVLEVRENPEYKIEKIDNKLEIHLDKNFDIDKDTIEREENVDRGDVERDIDEEFIDIDEEFIDIDEEFIDIDEEVADEESIEEELLEEKNEDYEEKEKEELPKGEVRISHNSKIGYHEVVINTETYKGYEIRRFTNPDRVVIDIPNTKLNKEQKPIADIDSPYIQAIRYSQFDENTVRVVLDLKGLFNYEELEKEGKLIVKIVKPTHKNITYHNNGDRVGFVLNDSKLTQGGSILTKLYEEFKVVTSNKYLITFPTELANIGFGKIKINDRYLESIEIIQEGKNTSILFNAKDNFIYEVFTRQNLNNTAITLLKPAKPGERIVVIDPGHGGSDPGAVAGGTTEKELNLDISKRLNAILKEHNIKTYMIREDDSFVGLHERANIANSLDASLFISIHNNAFMSQYKGTETLYYPSSSGIGERLARLIQNNLVSTLNTVNRGIVPRPNLVVLNATKMPAALAEIAFMTNVEDMNNLKNPQFRQAAAQALADAIIQFLNETN